MGYDMHVRPRLRVDARPADYWESANYLRRNIGGMHPTVESMVEQANAAYDKAIAAGRTHPEIFLDDVIPFLRHAAESDGFEVW